MASDAESKPGDEKLAQDFMMIAAGVADGGLVMPAPFDVAASAALAANSDKGEMAGKLFDVTANRASRFEVRITEIQGEDSRDLLNTVCANESLLFGLLDDLMAELEARRPHI